MVGALLACAPAVAAQETAVPVDPIIVTLSALPLPLSEIPGSVTVVDRAAIESSNASTIAEVLRAAPFVDVSRTGGRGGLTTATIRGGDPNFTLVLLDGIPVNDPTNLLGGAFDFATLSVDNVERIEIVRGPLSSRFGSEALAGVINIVSRRGAEGTRWSAEGSVGASESRSARLATRGGAGSVDYSASGSYLDIGEQVENDDYRLATAALTSTVPLAAGDLRLVSRIQDAEVAGFPENGGGPRFSILRDLKRTRSRELVFGLSYRRAMLPGWELTAMADLYDRASEERTPPVLDAEPPGPRALPSLENDTDFDRARLGLTSAWDPAAGFSVFTSLEARRERGRSDGTIAEEIPAAFSLERTTRSAAMEIVVHAERLVLDAALRLDDPEGFDSEVSPRVALVTLFPDIGTRMSASWGMGFKLPSFFALGEPNVGNPDLGPERSRGVDLSIAQTFQPADLLVSLTVFRQRMRDLIDFSPEEFRLVNRRLARTRGVEIEARWQPWTGWTLASHARWLDADLVGTDEPLRDRPRWRGGARVEWQGGRTRARLVTVWVGERFDFQIPVPERRTAGGYATTALALSRDFGAGLTAFLRIDNLLDREYAEFVGFPAPGRYTVVGLRYEP